MRDKQIDTNRSVCLPPIRIYHSCPHYNSVHCHQPSHLQSVCRCHCSWL